MEKEPPFSLEPEGGIRGARGRACTPHIPDKKQQTNRTALVGQIRRTESSCRSVRAAWCCPARGGGGRCELRGWKNQGGGLLWLPATGRQWGHSCGR